MMILALSRVCKRRSFHGIVAVLEEIVPALGLCYAVPSFAMAEPSLADVGVVVWSVL